MSKSEIKAPELYFAYYWRRSSKQDGWWQRKTVPCDSSGRLDKFDYSEVLRGGWIGIGFYKHGEAPENVWDAARV